MLFEVIAWRYFTRSRPVSARITCQLVSNSGDGFARCAIFLFEVRESFRQETAFPFGELRSCGAMRFDQRCFHGEGFRLHIHVIRCWF